MHVRTQHTHTRTRAHTHTQTPKHPNTRRHMHTHAGHTHICTHATHTNATRVQHRFTHKTYVRPHTHAHTHNTHMRIHKHKNAAHTCIKLYSYRPHIHKTHKNNTLTRATHKGSHTRAQHTHARMHTRMHTSTCTCIHVMYATHTKKNKSAPLTFSTHIQTHTCARITSTYTCAHTQVDIYTRGYRHSLSFVAGKEACACLCSGACRAQALSDQQPLLFL